MTTIAVVGASGFIGSAVRFSLERAGVKVRPVRAPRLTAIEEPDIATQVLRHTKDTSYLARKFDGCCAVINCAGDPDASSQIRARLLGANALLPGVVGVASQHAAVPRYVHVSSAVVQGRADILDSTTIFDAFSTYAQSKVMGEFQATRFGPTETCIYRPPSVHAASRRITRGIAWLAASPFSSVASPPDSPTPQALIANVADAIRYLSTSVNVPPGIVHHPSEHLTTALLLELLGGKAPRVVPRRMARPTVSLLEFTGRAARPLAPHARRIEMLWFGQGQATSWLDDQGWIPIEGHSAWADLGQVMQSRKGK